MKGCAGKELAQRVMASLVGVVILVFITLYAHDLWGRWVFVATLSTAVAVALWEYLRMVKIKGLKTTPTLTISCAVLYVFAVFIGLHFAPTATLPFTVALVTFLALFLAQFALKERSMAGLAMSFFGFFYIAVCLASILPIMYLDSTTGKGDGRWWFFYLMVVTKLTDTGAFFVGKRFGKTKLTSRISPNKTLEGYIGGIATSILASICFSIGAAGWPGVFTLSLSLGEALLWGTLIGVFAHLGDLAESLLKRDAGVKDSNSLPGLGGMLDIVDSLLFTAPVLSLLLNL